MVRIKGIVHRYLIEAIKVCTPFKVIFCCLFGTSFMLIACSEVKILKKEKGVLFAWLWCHDIYGKSEKPDFYF